MKLIIGQGEKRDALLPLQGGYLFIDDEGLEGVRTFDPMKHSFNPLRGMDYKRARDFADIVFSGVNKELLTIRNGKRALVKLLLDNPARLDKIKSASKDPAVVEALATIEDLLLSPVLREVLCNPTNFSFKGKVCARLNRAELGDFDAFVLGSLLIGQSKGPVVVPDFGFYGRELHTSLVRQNRLYAGVNYLSELPQKLLQSCLTIKDKIAYRTTLEDAERLLTYFGVTNASQLTDQGAGDFVVSKW